MASKVLLITPPFTQLNTPYPGTLFLTGYLKANNIKCTQRDLGIDLMNTIFTKSTLNTIFSVTNDINRYDENINRIYSLQEEYCNTIESVVRFLQNKDNTLAHRICRDGFLPEAGRFEQLVDLDEAFGTMGIHDQARYLSTLYLEDIGDFIQETITSYFGFSRYAESLSLYARSFDDIEQALHYEENLIDYIMLQKLEEYIVEESPSVVGLSVPFPGNLFAALKCGQWLKKNYPNIHVTMGGGYPNTELRQLKDSRVFKYIDSICLDDGEICIEQLLKYINGTCSADELVRTYLYKNDKVIYFNNKTFSDIPHSETGIPDYSGIDTSKYLSVIELANPMNRLWSDGRWNKLMLAHGCYWHKCSFCDTSLDYIKRYSPMRASELCDRIERVIVQTGETGFHFVDEAAPPSLLRDLAIEILKRKIQVTWWANVRFEKQFSHDLCRLLAKAGCIGVSGGLEVASDRLLTLMNKGVSIEQVARVTRNFADSNILVHAYLMYGFPTETDQETIDSLEVVRQLFEEGCIHSAFWHRFTMTVHSPVGIAPEKFEVKQISEAPGLFANNDKLHEDALGAKHEKYSEGLKKATYNFMHNVGFDFRLREWFDFKIPPSSIPHFLISKYLSSEDEYVVNEKGKIFWFQILPKCIFKKKSAEFIITTNQESLSFFLSRELGVWLNEMLQTIVQKPMLFSAVEEDFPFSDEEFENFLNSEAWQKLRETGLLLL